MTPTDTEGSVASELREIPVGDIQAGEFQPREVFDTAGIEQLASSVRQHGVLEPLLVRKAGRGWELIAGERRLRAAKKAGLGTVPVRVLEVEDERAAAIALTENLDREDLSPIEEARGLGRLKEVLEKAGKKASQRELRDKTTYSLGSVSELLKINREITEEVVAEAGVSSEDLREIPRSSLVHIASEDSLEDKADLLRRAVKAEHPTLVTSSLEERQKRDRRRKENRDGSDQEEGQEAPVTLERSGNELQVTIRSDPDALSTEESRSLVEELTPVLRELLATLPSQERKTLIDNLTSAEGDNDE